MRSLHRIFSIAALILLLWMGVSGTLMQLTDLYALLTHLPGDDPNMLSLNEGTDGNGAFSPISLEVYRAPALPAGLDYARGFSTVMLAAQAQHPGLQPRFVELRMGPGGPVGQVAVEPAVQRGPSLIQNVAAFDATSGALVTPVPFTPVGPPQPPSLRQTFLEWHRVFTHGAGPGKWFLLAAAIVMWVMIISGLSFYWQMLKKRRELGRNQLFWKAGGWWRSLHRAIALVGAVFLIFLAFTGSWLAGDTLWHSYHQPMMRGTDDGDRSHPLTAAQVQQMALATLQAFRAREPETPIKLLRVRYYAGWPQGVIVTGGNRNRQVIFNTDTRERQGLTEPGYPPSSFPFGDQMHQDIKHIHSGAMFGVAARLLNLFGGLCLDYLTVSGLVMYFNLWRLRYKTGRRSLLWL